MLKKFLNIIKKIILAVLIIYAYNRLAFPIGVVVPINIITVLFVTICGIPSILVLVLFSLLFI